MGDVIEIENDGVARTVTAVGATTITFDTALPTASAADALVENWGAGATNLDIDLSLAAGSVCIDAASGDYATSVDILGNPRVDDPAVDNTGVGTPAYVDMGAFERP